MESVQSAAVSDGKPLLIRRMDSADVADAMRLCSVAGWNQTEQDWRRFQALEPSGCFVASLDGRICGTATALDYGGRFGWIGMILVDPDRRRQGIGALLLKKSAEYLERAAVETLRLDATPMGHSLYLQLGFVDEFEIQRWHGIAQTTIKPRLDFMSRDDLARVCLWDRTAFGADRTRLLTSVWDEGTRYSAVVLSGDEVVGYMMGRAGRRAHHFGPWVATREDVAGQLFHEFLSRVEGEPVFVDVPSHNVTATRLVRSSGFTPQRPLIRMYRGAHRFRGRPEMVCGIAGPELG